MAKDNRPVNAPGERQKFHFQFITTPTADTPGTTLLLHFDNRRYFFGRIAEGTQRACIQRGIGIKKVRNLFLTGPTSWSNMGGLIGMVLTMADVQHDEVDAVTGRRPNLRIAGGPKLMHSIACARRFVFRTGMPLEIHEASLFDADIDSPSYADENIDVWSIPVSQKGRTGADSPVVSHGRSKSPSTVKREQSLRAETVKNMFDSDWRKDRLVESRFDEVRLPALIWTRDPITKELNHTQCSTMADAPHLRPESRVLVRNPWPASLVEELPPVDNVAGSVAMSYIVRGKPQRGKFQPQKAKALGVKPGPNYALLTAGGSVTLENGNIVTSDMVLDKTDPGKGMAILDVPSIDYLEDLCQKIGGTIKAVMEGVETVSWLLGDRVISSAEFTHVLKSLPDKQHIISSPDITPNYLALDSAAASSIRLGQIRPECFKDPVHSNVDIIAQNLPSNISFVPAERGLIVQITPKTLTDKCEVPPLLNVPAIKASYRDILQDLIPVNEASTEPAKTYDDIQILTLGTGSAVPSKYRNVSATLIRIPNLGSYLFDCGENTIGMLKRLYTAHELDDVLADLRMIWISHLHADHHLGTLSIIEAKRRVMQQSGETESNLHVISEPNMADYLIDYGSIESSSHCRLLGVLNSAITLKNGPSAGSSIDITRTSLPIKEFLTTRVSHCHGAQACSVTFNNGFKFSYSGDCRPSAQFAKIGRNSDVLLHEATFDDGLEGDAMAKKHSTTAEALAVAYAMKAKNVVLTHFSQRYQKIPVLNNVKFGEVRFEDSNDTDEAGPIENDLPIQVNEGVSDESATTGIATPSDKPATSDSIATLQQVAREMNVCVAFDLMSVTVGQIRDMYKYYPAIEKMFELEQEKSDAKREKRREALVNILQAKETKDAKWKTSSVKKRNAPEAPGGNLYDRINRSKTKGNKQGNGSSGRPNTGRSENNVPGDQRVPEGRPQPPQLHQRTKRHLQKTTAAHGGHNRQVAAAQQSSISGNKPGDSNTARRSSPPTDTRGTKRVKLADEELKTSEHQS